MGNFSKAILIASVALCLHISAFSQGISLKNKEISVKEAMELLKEKSGYSFVFSSADVNTNKRISISTDKATIDDVVKQILQGQNNLTYEIQNKRIIVKKIQPGDKTKNKKIKAIGKVVDDAGEPIIGATVREQGTTNGTITGIDGSFSLDVADNVNLEISYIGYETRKIRAQQGKKLDITMREDANVLDEVVVLGYGNIRRSDVTGSIASVSSESISKVASASVADALAGKMAGVQITTADGALDAEISVRVRGGGSITQDNSPLFLVDGFPVDDLSGIPPTDIESIDVLKEASMTAIYGARGANGVVIVTTKNPKMGKTTVQFNSYLQMRTLARKIPVMNNYEFVMAEYEYQMIRKGSDEGFIKNFGYYDDIDLYKYTNTTDWQDEIFKTSFSTDHNVNVSGAIPHMPYRVSVSYTNENGILKTSNMERLTGAISLNPNFFDKKLNIQLNVKGIYNTNRFADTGAIGMATQYDPTQPIYMDGNPYGNGYFMYMKSGNNPTPVDIGLANPVSILDSKHDESTVYRSIGNAQIDYKFHFLPELRANLNLGYDVSKSEGDVIIEDNAPMTWCQGNYKTGFGENSSYYQLKRNTLLDFYLNYAKEFGAHHVDVMGGYSWQHFYNSTWTKYPYSTVKAEETGKEFYKDMEDYSTENYLVSFFGRLNYTLLNRYLVTFTLRNDGSSRFNKDNRWGLFPSVALAWKMKEENFLKGVDWLSDLKLRLGYGITGQQNLNNGDYPYMARYMYSKAGANYYFGNNKYSLIAPQAYDENLKWEETTTYNIGLDFGVLNNKLTGTLDLYYRKTDDLLNTVTAPAGTNFSNQLLTNVGTLENKGIELTLTAHPITTKDWDWTLSYNISYNKNEITKLTFNDDPAYKGVIHTGIDGATGYNIMINAVDHPYNSFYVWEQLYDKAGNPIEGAYVDQNGDNKIDEEDLVAYKKSAPDVFMGLTSQLSYKNWDLSFALRASIGNYAYNNVQSNREAWDGSQMYDQTGFLKNRLTSAWKTNFKTGQYRSSYYVQNASFVRMDNISLGYTFNKLFNDKQSARVYVTVQNPFVITKYDGLDPEISGSGVDNNIYPRPRVFMLGLNLNF